MNKISPKFARELAKAVCRKIGKRYINGLVGVYEFNGQTFSTKAALAPAVREFCDELTYEQAAQVQRNYDTLV